MKALVIGAMGFAGRALTKELKDNGYEVIGTDIVSDGDDVIKADMLNKKEAFDLIEKIKPEVIFNLAGQASPLISWKDINLTMHLNVDLSVNIAEAVLASCPDTKILYIGSANQYDMASSDKPEIDEKQIRSGFKSEFKLHKRAFYNDKGIPLSRKILAVGVFNFYPAARLFRGVLK